MESKSHLMTMPHPDQTAEEYRKESRMWEFILVWWPVWLVMGLIWQIGNELENKKTKKRGTNG